MAVYSRISSARTKVVTAIVLGALLLMTLPPTRATTPSLDDQLIVVKGHTQQTEQVVQLVREQLALLPDLVKTKLIAYRVTVVIAPFRKEVLGTAGGACFDIKSRQVVLPERNDLNNTFFMKQGNRRAVVLHEIGHAYDHASGRLSFTPQYLQIYSPEERNVPANKRKLLAYFLESDMNGQPNADSGGRPHRPPQECFASLFATKYINQDLPRLSALKACFPRTCNFVYSQLP